MVSGKVYSQRGDSNETMCIQDITALQKSHRKFLNRGFLSKQNRRLSSKISNKGKLFNLNQVNKYLRQQQNPDYN